MDQDLDRIYQELKARGLTPEREARILAELHYQGSHDIPADIVEHSQKDTESKIPGSLYDYHDLALLQDISTPISHYTLNYRSIDELLERDKQREKDGFPKKIRIGRLIKPGKGGKDRFVVVPSTVEEKFVHDRIREAEDESASGGAGDGEEGEVIGEQPVREGGEGTGGSGEGESGPHDIESNAYDLGRILTEKFELPNLKDKGKKRSLTRYTYDLTDRHKGFGQILDKKATLREIVETNIHLGNIPDFNDIDTTRLLVSPTDKVYRILSKEKDYESQAMVFFLRDYSGSMAGKPTELVVAQHVLIYSWLIYQYARQVESRFILHDTEAKEVPEFYTYYNSRVAGGTKVASAYRLVNEIVEKENLEPDYNIYVFHGTDGDDWDSEGKETIPALKKMLTYANRIGITIAQQSYGSRSSSTVEIYLKNSGLLTEKPDHIRKDVIDEDADEQRLIDGIKTLIS
ncbi:DUF444 family protein [candidate division CSSED10-310 bacterium]|uniref:DUF444 family protein n=1 Tax=candidate division CSSED10-310 bacterium TaxID=2855610 RepID=A0ABV6Z301_UNCC1